MRKRYLTILLVIACKTSMAQLPNTNGNLSGSFESYSQLYHQDKKINAVLPQDRVGSNNFLKLDYSSGAFSAGIQFEGYLPAIAGFPFAINQNKLVNRYFKYAPKNFSVQVGDIYEQFGSGLIFRAWENRQIGINNAIEGIRVTATPVPFVNLKAIYGNQRKVFEHANSIVRGIDAEIDFSKINNNYQGNTRVAAGLSYVTRYQQYTGPDPEVNATVHAVSGRLDVNGPSASIGLEYVQKGSDPNNNSDDRAFYRLGADAVRAIDTTGAGDAFNGALAAAIACGPELPMRDHLRFASRYAALSTEQHGAAAAMPTRADVEARFVD